MRTFVKIVYENGENRITFTGRTESLTQLPDSVLPSLLHKHILSSGKYRTELSCCERQYKIHILNERYRQVTFKAAGNDLYLWEAVFSDKLFQQGWTLAGLSARVSVKMKKSDLKEFFIVTEWLSPKTGETIPLEEVGSVSIKFDYEDKNLIFTGRKDILRTLPSSVCSGIVPKVDNKSTDKDWKIVKFDEDYCGMKVERRLEDLNELRMEEQLMKEGWRPVASSFHPHFEHNGHSVFQKWLAPKHNCNCRGERGAVAASAPPPEHDEDSDDLCPPPSYEEVMNITKKITDMGIKSDTDGACLEAVANWQPGLITIQFDHIDDKVIFSGSLENIQLLPPTVFPAALKEYLLPPLQKETPHMVLPETGRYPESKIYFLDDNHRVVKMKRISAVSMEALVGDNLLRRKWTLVGYSGRLFSSVTGHHVIEKWQLPNCPTSEVNFTGQQPGILTIGYNYEYSHVSFLGRNDVLNTLPKSVLPGVVREMLSSTNAKVKMRHEKEIYKIHVLPKKPLCLVKVNRKLDYLSEPSVTETMSEHGWTLVACCANVKDRRDDFKDRFIILQKWSRPIKT